MKYGKKANVPRIKGSGFSPKSSQKSADKAGKDAVKRMKKWAKSTGMG